MAAVRPAPRGRPSTHDAPPSLWASAAAAGAATAVLAASVAVVVVAIVWLPASGASGSAGSTLRAGTLTFLAGLHAGITVDGIDAGFVPLGLTLLVARLTWRSGAALAAAADDAGETRPGRLFAAGAVQSVAFAVVCGVLAAVSRLGTSSVPVAGATVAAFVLCALTGGVSFVRSGALRDVVAQALPAWVARPLRAAAVAVAVYLGAGCALVAGSVVLHHDRVGQLSGEVGGGWSGVPVLLLGVLAAPNAAVAAAGYLSGAGFSVGTDTTVALGATSHGVVPAFPVLGALPDGTGSTLPAWLLAGGTALVAGVCVAVVCRRGEVRWRDAGLAVLGLALGGVVLAWLAGGAIGPGRLSTVGVSLWRFPVFLVLVVGSVTVVVLGVMAVVEAARAHERGAAGVVRTTLAGVRNAVSLDDAGGRDDDSDDIRTQVTEDLRARGSGGDEDDQDDNEGADERADERDDGRGGGDRPEHRNRRGKLAG